MSQLPMKVSEAVERMQQEVTRSGPHSQIVVVKISDLSRILASHEALRLAGEAVTGVPYNPSDIADLGTIVVSRNEYLALSLAVEEASK